ncbi:hypothetical protein DSM112329_02871 [Paraconexibacter sp. AEG42_29]|uniref:Uncharacterized protein n=2 Tax=Paraconexibacter sp. AEG42_29 TaxID=2997339 RepID=A0AAU7AX11_9ACTN
MLRGEVANELPSELSEAGWTGLEQGWWASIQVRGQDCLLAETSLDALIEINGAPETLVVGPGQIEVSGVPVMWTRVPLAAYTAAWASAIERCTRGAPAE